MYNVYMKSQNFKFEKKSEFKMEERGKKCGFKASSRKFNIYCFKKRILVNTSVSSAFPELTT